MGRDRRTIFPGAIYHAMARGNDRQDVFLCERDWETGLDILASLKSARPFRLHAYCLLSNHLHLLIEPLAGSLSSIMGILLSRYAIYLNRRLERSGHVFEERFRSYVCRGDAQFLQWVRYIHLNPVRAGIVDDPSDWPYSGHREYLRLGRRRLLDPDRALSMFADNIDTAQRYYQQFIQDGLREEAEDIDALPPSPIQTSGARSDAGPDQIIAIPPQRGDIDLMTANCASAAGISREALLSATKRREVCRARHAFMKTALHSGYSMSEIAAHLRLSIAAVSKALSLSETRSAS